MPLPRPTRIPSTWRTRCPAAGHPSVSRQRDPGPSREGWRLRAGCVFPAGFSFVSARLCLPLLHAGYRAGDSDTEDECWSDTEAVPQPRPREKALSRSQSLRVIKRKPPVREVSEARGRRGPGLVSPGSSRCAVLSPTGHFTLPEGPDEEEDRALRRGQLGPTQPAQSYLVSCGALRAVQKGALAAPAPPGSALLAPAVG